MSAAIRTPQSRLLLIVGVLLAIVRFVDFFFYGRHAYDLVGGIGFIAVAAGAYFDGFRTLEAVTTSGRRAMARGYALAILGVILVIASMLLKYAF